MVVGLGLGVVLGEGDGEGTIRFKRRASMETVPVIPAGMLKARRAMVPSKGIRPRRTPLPTGEMVVC